MTIDKQEIKALALACDPAKCADEAEEGRRLAEFYSELTPEVVLALLTEIKQAWREAANECRDWAREVERRREVQRERDQLKAENEQLRKVLGEISGQVDGNIRCTVRDVVNGLPDVQDIYGYCDAIDEIIDAALAREVSR